MKIAVVGGGPAGLRAAEIASAASAEVTLFERQPSVGRKFLVAGRGGLNLTKAEPTERFATRYVGRDQPAGWWETLIAGCDVQALRDWAESLGVETFVASTGRVYPKELKAAPLLRRWVQRLRERGVHLAMRHRLVSLAPGKNWRLGFETDAGPDAWEGDAVILALGGASWPSTGSDGTWTEVLSKLGTEIAPWKAANCGWEVAWKPAALALSEGHPIKNVTLYARHDSVRGELLFTRYGLEGGAIYALGSTLRAMEEPALTLDFKPDQTIAQLVARMGPIQRNFLPEAQVRWKLSVAAAAILQSHEPFASVEALARMTKAFPLPLLRPRPIAEAISSAGGASWSGLNEHLMLRAHPGLFLAGEMIDWEAPTGGYLIHGCFAMGTRAAEAAVRWCAARHAT